MTALIAHEEQAHESKCMLRLVLVYVCVCVSTTHI